MSFRESSQKLPKDISFTEKEVDKIFQQFFSAYSNAVSNIGETTDACFRLARQTVLVKFAGNNLANVLTRALSHVRIDSVSKPDFTIYVWDSKSSNQHLPPFLEKFTQTINSVPGSGLCSSRGDIPLLTNKKFRTAFAGSETLSMTNVSENTCIHWLPDSAKIPYYDAGAPLRVPFSLMFSTSSRQLIHGGAVGNVESGVFLGGVGGSGKSTTALNCLDSPLYYASDDYVMVDLQPQPTAYSIYNTAKVKTIGDLERFPRFRSWIANEKGVKENQEKPMIFLNEYLSQKLIGEIPLKAIVFPKFKAGAEIRYQQMSQQRAFREVVTSTLQQTPNDEKIAIPMIGRFIKELPCYELIFGEDQTDVTKYIIEIIHKNS